MTYDELMEIACDKYCRYSNGDARNQEELDRECGRCKLAEAVRKLAHEQE